MYKARLGGQFLSANVQCGGEFAGGLRAAGRVGREQRAQQRHQRGGHPRGGQARQRQYAAQLPGVDLLRRAAGKGRLTGQRETHRRPQRVEVRGQTHVLPHIEVLQAGEGRRAHKVERARQGRTVALFLSHGFGQAVVDDLDLYLGTFAGSEHQVGRLEVAVRQPAPPPSPRPR